MKASLLLKPDLIAGVGYPLTDVKLCDIGGKGFTANLQGTTVKFSQLSMGWLSIDFPATNDALVLKYDRCIEEYVAAGKVDELWIIMPHFGAREGIFSVGIPKDMALLADDAYSQESFNSMNIVKMQGSGNPYTRIEFLRTKPNNNFVNVTNIGWVADKLIVEVDGLQTMRIEPEKGFPIEGVNDVVTTELFGKKFTVNIRAEALRSLRASHGVNYTNEIRKEGGWTPGNVPNGNMVMLVDYCDSTIEWILI